MDSNELYYKGYRIKIYPTQNQAKFIDRCINANRYVYNWAIEQQNIQYELYNLGMTDKSYLSKYELDKLYTSLRSKNEWLKEIPHNTGRSAIRRVSIGMKRFFRGQNKRPKFKSKKNIETFSFKTRADRMFFDNNMLRIEGLPKDDMIYTKWNSGYTKYDRKFYNPVISKDNLGEYWLSYELLEPKPVHYFEENNIPSLNRAIGIDLNVKDRIVLSTGEVYRAPDTTKLNKRLKRLQRKCQKDRDRHDNLERTNPDIKIPVSNRAFKRIIRLRKDFHKVHNINNNFINLYTKKIIDMHPSSIVMESMKVTDMDKRKYIAKYTHTANFYTIRDTLQYKASKYGVPFILAPEDYKSSQICSNCGHEKNIGSRKTYICPVCGLRINRDINAAINLEKLAYA